MASGGIVDDALVLELLGKKLREFKEKGVQVSLQFTARNNF